MTLFKKILLPVVALLLLSTGSAMAQHQKHGLTWYTDITQAYEISKKTNKPVFAFFTGSDWCGWCHKLEKAVFVKDGFQSWAKKNVILLELDFPRKKQLPEALANQNASLQQFFNVQGYPTIWMFNIAKDSTNTKFNITPLGSLGYPRSAPGQEEATFLQNANGVLSKNKS